MKRFLPKITSQKLITASIICLGLSSQAFAESNFSKEAYRLALTGTGCNYISVAGNIPGFLGFGHVFADGRIYRIQIQGPVPGVQIPCTFENCSASCLTQSTDSSYHVMLKQKPSGLEQDLVIAIPGPLNTLDLGTNIVPLATIKKEDGAKRVILSLTFRETLN